MRLEICDLVESGLIIRKEVQVGVVGLDLDIGMKLSMRRIPYEGAGAGSLFVRQQGPHYQRACTAATATQLSSPLNISQ